MLSHVPLFVTPWTVAHQVPLSMGFLWQKYWSGLPFPELGIEPGLLHYKQMLYNDLVLGEGALNF